MSRMESYNNNDLPHLREISERGGGVLRNKSQMNTLLPSDRSQFTKKLPVKCMSFQASFRRSSGSFLPEFAEGDQSLSKSQHHHKPLMYKASQKGRGDLLPTISATKSEGYVSDQGWNAQPMTFRASERGKSDVLPTTTSVRVDGYASDQSKNRYQTLSNVKTISQKLLRRRTASTNALNSDDSSHRRNSDISTIDYHYYPGKIHHNVFQKLGSNLWRFVKKSDWTQIIILCCVFYIVYDSYIKLVATSGQLQKLRDDEGMMLLHLHRLEQQSIRVHENIAKIGEKKNSMDQQPPQNSQKLLGGGGGESDPNGLASRAVIDDAEIHAQTQQLYEMEQELDHELHSLQEKLQQAARASITSKYGDGPIKVVLEIEIPDDTDMSNNQISILLWYDTPHAAWTWLKQILVGEWDGSEFQVGELSSIDAQPIIYNAGTLDFLEKSQKTHELWTVGLSNQQGNLNMFINLKDNSNSKDRQYAVCVGKVIDGFDVIKKMLRSSHKNKSRPIRIHTATATQLHRDGAKSIQ
jgi:hypothetical protein